MTILSSSWIIPRLTAAQIRDVLNEIELVNAKIHGYGARNFGRNLQQAYQHLAEREIARTIWSM